MISKIWAVGCLGAAIVAVSACNAEPSSDDGQAVSIRDYCETQEKCSGTDRLTCERNFRDDAKEAPECDDELWDLVVCTNSADDDDSCSARGAYCKDASSRYDRCVAEAAPGGGSASCAYFGDTVCVEVSAKNAASFQGICDDGGGVYSSSACRGGYSASCVGMPVSTGSYGYDSTMYWYGSACDEVYSSCYGAGGEPVCP